MQEIDITPNAAKLIESMRYLTYTNETAIADLVDNSFDAGADEVSVLIDKKNNEILVVDNGCGMTPEVMQQAIKLGSNTIKDQTELGRFGMGLVTASISMGRRIEVVSKVEGGEPFKVVLDLDHIIETDEWKGSFENTTPTEDKAFDNVKSGTLVRVCKLDSIKANIGTATAKHLRRVFRSFLMAGKKITVNWEQLTPMDPLARNLKDTEILYDGDFEVEDSKVHVTVAHVDTSKSDLAAKEGDKDRLDFTMNNQGFYVVRNNREIANAETLGLYIKHNSKNRFRCEISFDGELDKEFGINFTKRDVHPTQAIKDKIWHIVAPYVALIGAQGEKDEQVEESEKINHSDAESVIKRKKSLLRTKTNWQEKHKKPTPKPDKDEKKDDKKDDKKKHKRVNATNVQPGKRAMPVEFREADLGSNGALFDCCFEGNKIIIRWNIRHPFHSQVVAKYSGNKNILTPVDLLIYSIAQEQLMLDESDPDDVKKAQALNDAIVGISHNLRTLLQ